MIQIFLISSIFFAAKKFTIILCEVHEKNTNRRAASAVSENQRRNGFIYQEHEDLIIVLNIHRTKGSQTKANENGNGRSFEWYNKLHIDQQ